MPFSHMVGRALLIADSRRGNKKAPANLLSVLYKLNAYTLRTASIVDLDRRNFVRLVKPVRAFHFLLKPLGWEHHDVSSDHPH